MYSGIRFLQRLAHLRSFDDQQHFSISCQECQFWWLELRTLCQHLQHFTLGSLILVWCMFQGPCLELVPILDKRHANTWLHSIHWDLFMFDHKHAQWTLVVLLDQGSLVDQVCPEPLLWSPQLSSWRWLFLGSCHWFFQGWVNCLHLQALFPQRNRTYVDSTLLAIDTLCSSILQVQMHHESCCTYELLLVSPLAHDQMGTTHL